VACAPIEKYCKPSGLVAFAVDGGGAVWCEGQRLGDVCWASCDTGFELRLISGEAASAAAAAANHTAGVVLATCVEGGAAESGDTGTWEVTSGVACELVQDFCPAAVPTNSVRFEARGSSSSSSAEGDDDAAADDGQQACSTRSLGDSCETHCLPGYYASGRLGAATPPVGVPSLQVANTYKCGVSGQWVLATAETEEGEEEGVPRSCTRIPRYCHGTPEFQLSDPDVELVCTTTSGTAGAAVGDTCVAECAPGFAYSSSAAAAVTTGAAAGTAADAATAGARTTTTTTAAAAAAASMATTTRVMVTSTECDAETAQWTPMDDVQCERLAEFCPANMSTVLEVDGVERSHEQGCSARVRASRVAVTTWWWSCSRSGWWARIVTL
jgi:hypothetical protein